MASCHSLLPEGDCYTRGMKWKYVFNVSFAKKALKEIPSFTLVRSQPTSKGLLALLPMPKRGGGLWHLTITRLVVDSERGSAIYVIK